MKWNNILVALALLVFAPSCKQEQTHVWELGIDAAEDTIPCRSIWDGQNEDVLPIRNDIDLKGKKCILPANKTLRFEGGVIKNGTLEGNGTRIEHTGVCFDRVRILGTWEVPEISTSMFKDLDYDNSLKDVVALANSEVPNKIVIEEGDYQVSAQHPGDVCVPISSNSHVILNGTIRLVPNDYTHYFIIRLSGSNIQLKGNGTIIGDKHTHTGNDGEWGMGIEFVHAHGVSVSNLNIKDCWGDCIHVAYESSDVLIEDCRLDHGRRQGISITSANNVIVRGCTITNVGGTEPQCAIDIEPYAKYIVDNVLIENVTVDNCIGGFKVLGSTGDAKVGTVNIKNCLIESEQYETLTATLCDTLIVENNNIIQNNGWACVRCRNINHLVMKGNTLRYDDGVFYQLKDRLRPAFGKMRVKVMDIEDCEAAIVENSKELGL